MTSRRWFLRISSLVAFLPGSAIANGEIDQSGGITSSIEEITKSAIQYYLRKGYRDVGELPLITNESFNGGLRYDDDMRDVTDAAFRVQHCSRIEDLESKGKAGVLPHFTMFAVAAPLAAKPEFFSDVLEFVVKLQQLDAKKMSITTTQMAEAHFPLFNRWGILDQQIRLRGVEEAKSQGDGSGYFAPKGHPRCTGFPSFSVHYSLPDGEEIEIAEVIFPEHGAGDLQAGVGIGLERLAMAKGVRVPTWEHALQEMHTHVRREIEERGGDAPEGYGRLVTGK